MQQPLKMRPENACVPILSPGQLAFKHAALQAQCCRASERHRLPVMYTYKCSTPGKELFELIETHRKCKEIDCALSAAKTSLPAVCLRCRSRKVRRKCRALQTPQSLQGYPGGGGGIRTPGPRLNRPFISSEVQSASLARLRVTCAFPRLNNPFTISDENG